MFFLCDSEWNLDSLSKAIKIKDLWSQINSCWPVPMQKVSHFRDKDDDQFKDLNPVNS